MIQLTAIVAGQLCTMLTESSIEQAAQSCRERFGDRFEGFAPIPTAVKARAKWAEYQEKEVTRAEFEEWLKRQDDEAEIRAAFNLMRG